MLSIRYYGSAKFLIRNSKGYHPKISKDILSTKIFQVQLLLCTLVSSDKESCRNHNGAENVSQRQVAWENTAASYDKFQIDNKYQVHHEAINFLHRAPRG